MKNPIPFNLPICKIKYLQPVPRKNNTFIQKVRTILEENISDENFGIPQLCQAVFFSRSQVHNKIKAQTGLSTSIFIRSIRLQKAKELLEETDKSISEVAYDVGYKDPSYFSRLYSEKFGKTPRATSKSTNDFGRVFSIETGRQFYN